MDRQHATEGSKMDSGAGAGIHSTNPKIELTYCAGKYESVYQAEIRYI